MDVHGKLNARRIRIEIETLPDGTGIARVYDEETNEFISESVMDWKAMNVLSQAEPGVDVPVDYSGYDG